MVVGERRLQLKGHKHALGRRASDAMNVEHPQVTGSGSYSSTEWVEDQAELGRINLFKRNGLQLYMSKSLDVSGLIAS